MESIKSKMILYSRTMNVGFRFICVDKELSKADKDEILCDMHTFWDMIDNRRILLNRRHLIVRMTESKKKVCMYKIFDAATGTTTRSTCSLEGLSFDSYLSAFNFLIIPQFCLDESRLNFNIKERDEEKDIEYIFSNNGEENTDKRIAIEEKLREHFTSSDNDYAFIIVEDDADAEKPFKIFTLNGVLPLELKRYIK